MKDLTKGNIYKNFILFAIPLVLSGLLSQAYNIIDTIIAGKFLGSNGIAAIGATGAFMDFTAGIYWGFAAGFAIYIARLFGAKDYENMRTSIYSNCFIMLVSMLALCIVMCLLVDPIFKFLQVDEAIYDDAATYFRIYILGLTFITFNNTGVHISNSLGMSSFPLKMSILSTVLNISGNIFSVTVLNAGVAGIAFSSVIAGVIVDICYIIKIQGCFSQLNLKKCKKYIDLKSVKRTLSYSLPTTLQQMTMYLASLIVSPFVNGISSSATAAYTVVLKIYSINSNIYQNSTRCLSSYTAQCIGAQKFNQLKKGVKVGFLQANLFVLPILAVCVVFARKICMMFFPAGYTGEGLEFAVIFVRFYLPLILFNLVNNLFHGFYRGVAAMGLLITVTMVGALSRVLLSIALSPILGISGIYAALALSWVIEAVITVILYFSGSWKKRLIRDFNLDETVTEF